MWFVVLQCVLLSVVFSHLCLNFKSTPSSIRSENIIINMLKWSYNLVGYCSCSSGFPPLLVSPGFFPKISRTWKILENKFGPGKSWKFKFKILESPGIYLLFNLTNIPFMYRTPCVNKCMKYSCYMLSEQFLCNLWWTFCDGLYFKLCCLSVI